MANQKQSLTDWVVRKIAQADDYGAAHRLAAKMARQGAYYADLRRALEARADSPGKAVL